MYLDPILVIGAGENLDPPIVAVVFVVLVVRLWRVRCYGWLCIGPAQIFGPAAHNIVDASTGSHYVVGQIVTE